MKTLLLIPMVLLFAICSTSVIAQPIAGNGCMTKTSPNRVYQNNTGFTYFTYPLYYKSGQYSEWTVQYDITTYNCYRWNPTGNRCYLYSSSGYEAGDAGYFSYSTTYCDLDDYILILLGLTNAIGFYFLRTKYLQT